MVKNIKTFKPNLIILLLIGFNYVAVGQTQKLIFSVEPFLKTGGTTLNVKGNYYYRAIDPNDPSMPISSHREVKQSNYYYTIIGGLHVNGFYKRFYYSLSYQYTKLIGNKSSSYFTNMNLTNFQLIQIGLGFRAFEFGKFILIPQVNIGYPLNIQETDNKFLVGIGSKFMLKTAGVVSLFLCPRFEFMSYSIKSYDKIISKTSTEKYRYYSELLEVGLSIRLNRAN